jgi:hypothetical protein
MKSTLIHRYCEFFKLPLGIWIPYFGGLWYRILSRIENRYIRKVELPQVVLNNKERDKKIIVSLTTFPARIHQVEYAIKSLMLQSYKPDRVVLWLATEQFQDEELPDGLMQLVDKGLEIRYCPDYRSHKKYFIALQEQKPDELVITFDDDIIYHPYCIERAVKKHLQFSNAIVCNQGKEIIFTDDSNQISPYKQWKNAKNKNKPLYSTMAYTGSGCLYPYRIMPAMTFEWEEIKKYALYADDIWIKVMGILNGIKVVRVNKGSKIFTTLTDSQTVHLAQINTIGNGNNETISQLTEKFPEIIEKILNEK